MVSYYAMPYVVIAKIEDTMHYWLFHANSAASIFDKAVKYAFEDEDFDNNNPFLEIKGILNKGIIPIEELLKTQSLVELAEEHDLELTFQDITVLNRNAPVEKVIEAYVGLKKIEKLDIQNNSLTTKPLND